MAFHFLVGDQHEGFSSSLVKRIKLFQQGKVTHVKESIEVFRKSRAQAYDAILLSDCLASISITKLVTALREIDTNRRTPIYVFSAQPELYERELSQFENVFAFHQERGLDEALRQLENWLMGGGQKEDSESHPPVKIDLRIVNQLIEATRYSVEMFSGLSKIEALPIESFYKSTRYIDHVALAGATGIMSNVFAGTILVAFPVDTFLKIMSGALGETCSELNNDLKSASGELINIIYGQAKTILVENMEMDFMKSRPYFIDDRERIRSYHGSSSYIVPFNCEAGRFFLIVAFESIKPKALSAN